MYYYLARSIQELVYIESIHYIDWQIPETKVAIKSRIVMLNTDFKPIHLHFVVMKVWKFCRPLAENEEKREGKEKQ